jgi:hypothetical protein
MVRAEFFLAAACAVGAGFGCGSGAPPGLDPNTAFSAAHDIQGKAKLAEAHVAACKADNTQCDPLSGDLKDIQETSANLEKASVAAGARP